MNQIVRLSCWAALLGVGALSLVHCSDSPPSSGAPAPSDDAGPRVDGATSSDAAQTVTEPDAGLPPPQRQTLALGNQYTCAIAAGGKLRCWGFWGGELDTTPTDVPGLESGVVSVTSGQVHVCALLNTGAVKCFGRGEGGRLGNGSSVANDLPPADVVGLSSGVRTIAAGVDHTCAATLGGAVKCWGENRQRQLGASTTGSFSSVPVDVPGLSSGVIALEGGFLHTCGVTVTGSLRCWGSNSEGQSGGTSATETPVVVAGLSGVQAVATGGFHTCALVTGGSLKCLGDNRSGELGNSSLNTFQSKTPVDVTGLAAGAVAVTAGGGLEGRSHTCVIGTSGAVQCWGYNGDGQLGNGATNVTPNPRPTDVVGLASGIVEIAAGSTHTCARNNTGAVFCWGANDQGQLGNGARVASPRPVPVAGL